MKIGLCTFPPNISIAASIGYDYVELPVLAFADLSESDFGSLQNALRSANITCEVCNMFFSRGMKVVGTEVDKDTLRDYVERAVPRIAALGAQKAVIGSGSARNIPEGWTLQQCEDDFVVLLRDIGDEAQKYGITLVVEPLTKNETNFINSVTHGLSIVEKTAHPAVKLLADFYHMRMEKEDIKDIRQTGDRLQHVHVAIGNGRGFPQKRDDDIFEEFFYALKDIGYKGMLSVEAISDNTETDAPGSLELMRQLAKEYGF
jgi:D-psicose/D-tagatose/L-ribulose 3-epimerase